MERDPVTVMPGDEVEKVIRLLAENELPGVPVVNEGGRCVGIVTEADLVLSEEESDLHLPHYVNLLGGVVFLEPLKPFEDRLRKAFASRVEEMMTPDPVTIEPRRAGRGRGPHDLRAAPQPPAGGRTRALGGCGHACRRARSADPEVARGARAGQGEPGGGAAKLRAPGAGADRRGGAGRRGQGRWLRARGHALRPCRAGRGRAAGWRWPPHGRLGRCAPTGSTGRCW